MYTLEQLQQKTFKELKGIGWELNVFPSADRRCRQNWIDALVGVKPPLLELLEVSPGVEAEPVSEPIEVQDLEPIEIQDQEPIESKFGRIVYPKLAAEPIEVQATEPIDYGRITGYLCRPPTIAPETKTLNGVENCSEADRPPNRGDNGRDRLESALEPAAKNPSSVDRAQKPKSMAHELLELFSSSLDRALELPEIEASEATENLNGVTFSPRFLALYSPPQAEKVYYKADCDGQLSLLDFEIESADEPPDPDDFESMFAFWAAYDAWCERTDGDSEHNGFSSEHNGFSSEHCEPLETLLTSLDSMCEWAPCPDAWYEPDTSIEPSDTLELLPIESSDTSNFSIPTFDDWCDRPNNNDKPPTAGVGARRPPPKPPSFPPMVVAAGDRANGIKKFARSATLLSGRAPPGGDAM